VTPLLMRLDQLQYLTIGFAVPQCEAKLFRALAQLKFLQTLSMFGSFASLLLTTELL
jgi:hypothetical protein